MADCEQVVSDIPYSPAAPGVNDVVIWTNLTTGQSVVRPFSALLQGVAPPDYEEVVPASGGTINDGSSSFTLAQFVNKRVRMYRGGVKVSSVVVPGNYYFSFDNLTGTFTISPAAMLGEIFSIEGY